jgi:hypothetical protein
MSGSSKKAIREVSTNCGHPEAKNVLSELKSPKTTTTLATVAQPARFPTAWRRAMRRFADRHTPVTCQTMKTIMTSQTQTKELKIARGSYPLSVRKRITIPAVRTVTAMLPTKPNHQ